MAKIVLHIGLHKTATTTLQEQFFPECEGVRLFTTKDRQMKSFVEYVVKKDPLYFKSEDAHAIISAAVSNKKINLLSNELLSGPPYAGAIDRGLDHRSTILSNLGKVFPEAKVILVLRRQDSLAKSFYRQYLKSGGTRSIYEYLWGKEGVRLPIMSPDRFLFGPYVDEVFRLFPRGGLLMPFEAFVENNEFFLRKITDFIGVPYPANISLRRENATVLGEFGLEVSRILNYLFRNQLNPGGILPGLPSSKKEGSRFISPVQILHDKWPGKSGNMKGLVYHECQKVLENVRQDNRSLDQKYNLGLDRYGYY